jgi:hypothetical protein
VKANLISVRRIVFTPSVEVKDELKNTAIQITCLDEDGNVLKRVTSGDSGEVENTEGDGTTDNGTTDSGSQNSGSQSGSDNSGSGSDTGGSGSDTGGSGGEPGGNGDME